MFSRFGSLGGLVFAILVGVGLGDLANARATMGSPPSYNTLPTEPDLEHGRNQGILELGSLVHSDGGHAFVSGGQMSMSEEARRRFNQLVAFLIDLEDSLPSEEELMELENYESNLPKNPLSNALKLMMIHSKKKKNPASLGHPPEAHTIKDEEGGELTQLQRLHFQRMRRERELQRLHFQRMRKRAL